MSPTPLSPAAGFLGEVHHTGYTACSAEFCPRAGWENWAVCATYQLVKSRELETEDRNLTREADEIYGGFHGNARDAKEQAAEAEEAEEEEVVEGGKGGEDIRKGSLLLYYLSESRDQMDPDGSNSGGHHRLIPVEIVEVGGGVLDCRWCPASSSSLFFSSPPSSPSSSSSPILACAVSTGCIVFYRLQVSGSEGSCGWEGNEERPEGTRLPRR